MSLFKKKVEEKKEEKKLEKSEWELRVEVHEEAKLLNEKEVEKPGNTTEDMFALYKKRYYCATFFPILENDYIVKCSLLNKECEDPNCKECYVGMIKISEMMRASSNGITYR